MLKYPTKALSAGAALLLASSGVWAQSSGNTATLPPATPLVGSQDAAKTVTPRASDAPVKRAKDDAKNADAVTPDKSHASKPGSGDDHPSEPANSATTTGTVNNTTTPSMAMGVSGTLPGADATSGDATNMRNNPGNKVDGKTVKKSEKPKP